MTDKQLDKVLYGQILEGKGPWPQGPKMLQFRKLRKQWHDLTFGVYNKCLNKPCPVCRPVSFIIK